MPRGAIEGIVELSAVKRAVSAAFALDMLAMFQMDGNAPAACCEHVRQLMSQVPSAERKRGRDVRVPLETRAVSGAPLAGWDAVLTNGR